MKNYAFLLLLVLFSCKKESKPNSISISKKKAELNEVTNNKLQNENLSNWVKFYQKENPDFRPELFQLEEFVPFNFYKEKTATIDEKDDQVYQPFFVYNKSKTEYIDFDSYNWFIDTDGNAGFDIDQQVSLVNIKNKSTREIAFYGSSYWIEEAYWKGDSVAVLLGNSYDKIPFKAEINFKIKKAKYFKYPNTVKSGLSYSTVRLKNKGIKIE